MSTGCSGQPHLDNKYLGFPDQALALVPSEQGSQGLDLNLGVKCVDMVIFAMGQEDAHEAVGIRVARSGHFGGPQKWTQKQSKMLVIYTDKFSLLLPEERVSHMTGWES